MSLVRLLPLVKSSCFLLLCMDQVELVLFQNPVAAVLWMAHCLNYDLQLSLMFLELEEMFTVSDL